MLGLAFVLLSGVCPAVAQTQAEMTQRAFNDADAAEKRRVAVAANFRGLLTPAASKAFERVERAWIKYRAANADWHGSFFRGGSMEPMVSAGTYETDTDLQTAELRALLSAAKAKAQFVPGGWSVDARLEKSAAYRASDQKLNQAYQHVMKHITSQGPVRDVVLHALTTSELAWLAYRDLDAAFAASFVPVGVSPLARFDEVLTGLTLVRTQDLVSAQVSL
jgi:uncharacterized protein YecT (DUF1311 family)